MGQVFAQRLALYQAVWELIAAGELISVSSSAEWQPSVECRQGGHLFGLRGHGIECHYPRRIAFLPLKPDVQPDVDVFLDGVDCKSLHSGIREAVQQALVCFRRSLYMPATAMLAAAVEATWTECGIALAKKLANAKLESVVLDQFASISKKIAEIQKALEQPSGKVLLKGAGQTVPKVNEAEAWTAVLRDRRNALHWSKAKSFIADHSGIGTLLMAAPIHLATLEGIRAACR